MSTGSTSSAARKPRAKPAPRPASSARIEVKGKLAADNRPRYNRDKLRYPSDLTDAEWALPELADTHSTYFCPYTIKEVISSRVVSSVRTTPTRRPFLSTAMRSAM